MDTAFVVILFVCFGEVYRKFENSLWNKRWGWIPVFITLLVGVFKNPVDIVNFSINNYGNPILMLLGAISINYVIYLSAIWMSQNLKML